MPTRKSQPTFCSARQRSSLKTVGDMTPKEFLDEDARLDEANATFNRLRRRDRRQRKPTKASLMKTLTATDAKYGFGRLMDLARAEPVTIAKHGRPVVVMMSVEEYERRKEVEARMKTERLDQTTERR